MCCSSRCKLAFVGCCRWSQQVSDQWQQRQQHQSSGLVSFSAAECEQPAFSNHARANHQSAEHETTWGKWNGHPVLFIWKVWVQRKPSAAYLFQFVLGDFWKNGGRLRGVGGKQDQPIRKTGIRWNTAVFCSLSDVVILHNPLTQSRSLMIPLGSDSDWGLGWAGHQSAMPCRLLGEWI